MQYHFDGDKLLQNAVHHKHAVELMGVQCGIVLNNGQGCKLYIHQA